MKKLSALIIASLLLTGSAFSSWWSDDPCDPCEKPCAPCYNPCYRASCEPLYDSIFSGWYVAASGSVGWHRDTTTGDTPPNCIDHCSLWGVNLAFGYSIEEWSFELEGILSYGENDSFRLGGATSLNDSGHIMEYGFLLNMLYEVPITDPFSVYIGAGIGLGVTSLEITNSSHNTDDSDAVFAYQAKAGVKWALTQCWGLFAGYRFYGTQKPHLQTQSGPTDGAEKIGDAPFMNSVELGVYYLF